MCKAKPGPRCAGHLRRERWRWTTELSAIDAARDELSDDIRGWIAANPGKDPEPMFGPRVIALRDKQARTRRVLSHISYEFDATTEGMSQIALSVSRDLGLHDAGDDHAIADARTRLVAAENKVYRWQDAGVIVPQSSTDALKTARADLQARTDNALTGLRSLVAAHINTDPGGYGGPARTDQIRFTNPAHAHALNDALSEQRRHVNAPASTTVAVTAARMTRAALQRDAQLGAYRRAFKRDADENDIGIRQPLNPAVVSGSAADVISAVQSSTRRGSAPRKAEQLVSA